MRSLILSVLVLCMAPAAFAADLICTIPTASVTRGTALCNEARLALRVPTSRWSNNACASYLLRMGLMEAEKISTTRSFETSLNAAVTTALDTLTATWPAPVAAACGDSITDTEFGEQCDDGGNVDGDGCDRRCQTE